MAAGNSQLTSRLFARKSIESLQREAQTHGLKRTLGPFNLMFLGVGCIIGAGVYVMTGNAAAYFAGPGAILSFVIAGSACALDRKSTRLNSSHLVISYAVFCL